MSQSLSSYTTKVQDRVDNTSTSAVGVIEECIKEIYFHIMERIAPFIVGETYEDQTVTAGTQSYTLSDFIKLERLYYKSSDSFALLKETDNVDHINQYINSSNGTPTEYYIKGLNVVLGPAPSDAGTLRAYYIATPEELTGASLIPDRYTRAVVNGAVWKYKAYELDPSATEYERYFLNDLSEMENNLATKSQILRPKLFDKR